MLVRITDNVHVAPEEVSYVETNPDRNCLYVCMKNGVRHYVGHDYGKSIYETQTRLLAELNAFLPTAEARG